MAITLGIYKVVLFQSFISFLLKSNSEAALYKLKLRIHDYKAEINYITGMI